MNVTENGVPAADRGKALKAAQSLVLYRGIRQDPIFRAMVRFLETVNEDPPPPQLLDAFGELYFLLAAHARVAGDAWQNHLLDLVLYDDNAFTRAAASFPPAEMGAALLEAARGDLTRLQALHLVDAAFARGEVLTALGGCPPPGGLPLWRDLAGGEEPGGENRAIRSLLEGAHAWGLCLDQLAAYHRQAGAGLFARYRAFRWIGRPGRLEGIGEPDPVTLEDLIGYHSQRQEVVANTERFLAGLPANNILLYGDRGTGKSSTVKALLNRYGQGALRMVEVAKSDLADFPRIVRELRSNPQRFILFVDDLSFEDSEVEYKELKAVLEGGLESRPANVVIYATSNRRHLIRERFADRQPEYQDNGEVRVGDTVQEKLSLADRFGITVLFIAPDKALYLEIVRGLARQRGISLPDDELERRALVWEVWQNGRSGRSARQFIDHICGEATSGE